MTGSMYAAVSGLKAHMSALNVIGNNVSNVNTTAYKATRYTFNEALYTTTRSGSDGTTVAGGRNPAQVGFGASIGTIDLDMSTKNYTPTGQMLDTMIDGDGFFMVGDKKVGMNASAIAVGDSGTLKGMNLTRLGNFNIDPNGFLVDGNGSVVWGFLEQQVDAPVRPEGDGAAWPDRTQLKAGTNDIVEITNDDGTKTYYQLFDHDGDGKYDKYLTELTEEDIENMKKRGVELHNVRYETVSVQKMGADGTTPVTDSDGNPVYEKVSMVKSATMPQTAAMGAIRLPMKNETYNQIMWPYYQAAQDAYWVNDAGERVAEGTDGATFVAAKPAEFLDDPSDGNVRLQADSVSIDEKSGALRVLTSDGQLWTVGYLALAKVTNPNGVSHVDGRYYQAQDGAGEIRITSVKEAVKGAGIDSAGDTKLITGGLESSGTDLATEITNMITVQRGYQANTRIVTVTDSMLEELVNMKR